MAAVSVFGERASEGANVRSRGGDGAAAAAENSQMDSACAGRSVRQSGRLSSIVSSAEKETHAPSCRRRHFAKPTDTPTDRRANRDAWADGSKQKERHTHTASMQLATSAQTPERSRTIDHFCRKYFIHVVLTSASFNT